jgi:hypothetical protein
MVDPKIEGLICKMGGGFSQKRGDKCPIDNEQ